MGKLLWVFLDRSGARLVVNDRPKEEKKSSVGSTWWNWKTVRCYAALRSRVHCTGTFADCTNFHFGIGFFSVYVYMEVTRPMGDFMIIQAVSLWRGVKKQQEEISLVNQPYPCVCIRNDFVNPCEEPNFWFDFFRFHEMVFSSSSRFFWRR